MNSLQLIKIKSRNSNLKVPRQRPVQDVAKLTPEFYQNVKEELTPILLKCLTEREETLSDSFDEAKIL